MSIMNAQTCSGGAGTVMRWSISIDQGPVYTVSTMPLQFGPRLKALLDEPLPVIVGTTRRDGSVQMNPVWYEYRDGQIWLNGGPARGWFQHMRRDPRVTLFVLDPKNMFRWAQIQGRLAGSTTEAADEH